MSFFEPPPPPTPPPLAAREPWWGAPSNELGVPVPLRLVLASTDSVAVAVLGVTAFKEGIEFRLSIRRRPRALAVEGSAGDLDPFYERHPFGHHGRAHRGGELPPEILRFGVQFSDGRKATSTGQMGPELSGSPGAGPPGPVLAQRGGRGGELEWEFDFWLWPLPHRGRSPSWSNGPPSKSSCPVTRSTPPSSSRQAAGPSCCGRKNVARAAAPGRATA